MAGQARYQVGDPVAAVKMRNAAGEVIDYTHQSLAGRALVLYLASGRESEEDWHGLHDLAGELGAMDALCAVVAPDSAATPPMPAGIETLIDPAGESAAAFGLNPPGLVLIGPDSRVAAALSGYKFRELAASAKGCHEATQPVISTAQAPVLTIDGVLEASLRERLLEYWERGVKRADTVSSTRQGSAAQVAAVKRRGDVIIEDNDLVALLRQRMGRRVLGEIRKVHHMEIVGHEAFRIGCYDAGNLGFFGRHRDNATPYTAHRRYALTLNLNDDYEGGELRFPEYGRMLYRPPAGGAVVFSCALLHEALPVTKGRRFVLLSFFFDREGARQEKERLARDQGKPRTL